MAHLHFKRDTYKSGGAAATKRLEYITRQSAQEFTPVERQLRYIEREGREDLVTTESRNLPAWAQQNPHTYFQAAERYEGKGWVAFEEYKITLPHEFTHEHNRALAEDLVAALGHGRLPLTYAFHDPQTLRGTRQQPHLHLLLSRRQTDDHVRTPEQHFRRYNSDHPGRGGAQKDPFFAERRHLWHQRVLVSDVINLHLERAGLEARVHPSRLSDRGLDREPEPKLLPSESREYREQGKVSPTMQKVLDIRAQRAMQWDREQRDAQQYWASRKGELGIERDMPHVQHLERIVAAREAGGGGRLTLEQLHQEERAIVHHERQLQGVLHQVAYYRDSTRPVPPAIAARQEALLAMTPRDMVAAVAPQERAGRGRIDERPQRFAEELVLPTPFEEQGGGRAARVRIWDDRHPRDDRERGRYDER